MRRARIDSTHREIRETLRKCGWLVFDSHTLPEWVDLVAYHPARGEFALVEAKAPKGKLKPSQERLVAAGWPVKFIRSAEEAARL